MPALPTPAPRQVAIKTDYDVVVVRQHVRQLARELGLGLGQQAKISTAISAVARALLAMSCDTTFRMYIEESRPRAALVISCGLPTACASGELAQLEQRVHFSEARALVDDATIALDSSGALISLRMWLSR